MISVRGLMKKKGDISVGFVSLGDRGFLRIIFQGFGDIGKLLIVKFGCFLKDTLSVGFGNIFVSVKYFRDSGA